MRTDTFLCSAASAYLITCPPTFGVRFIESSNIALVCEYRANRPLLACKLLQLQTITQVFFNLTNRNQEWCLMKSEKISTPESKTKGLSLLGWLVLCFAAASTGVFVSTGDWYSSLNKPSWNPPSWLFGPVWSVLYCMMAIAA